MDRFLSTKLLVPQQRPGLVSRQRLFSRLDEGLSRRLILLSAPAGFGKTSLLSEWVRQSGLKAVWISLDETDNDLARFIHYLSAAIQIIGAENHSGGPVTANIPTNKPTLTDIINRAVLSPEEFILVLDDYHFIRDNSIHEFIHLLLKRQPPQMHLVIATRSDPLFSLARLRARDQMIEIRAADLRFTERETEKFLMDSMGLDINQRQANILKDKTEGWIAGLQLAALSLKQGESISEFVTNFSGTHAYIADYLTQEILGKLEEGQRRFLLSTSILDRLTGSLCDFVTGYGGGQETLEELCALNLFVLPIDNQKLWYRYHRLFADLLTKRLEQTEPDLVSELHQRASLWFEQNGALEEAINHALKSSEFNRAGDLISLVAETTLAQSQLTTFLRWLNSLPDEEVKARPKLYIYQTLVQMMAGSQVEDIEARLDQFDRTEDGLQAGRLLLRAYLAAHRGQTPKAVKLAIAAQDHLVDEPQYLDTFANWFFAFTLFHTDQKEEAISALNEVLELSRKSGNVMVGVATLSYLALLRFRQGQLEQAEFFYQQALELAKDEQGGYLPIAGEALIGLGSLKLETYQLDEAEQALSKGIKLAFGWSEMAACKGYLKLAQLHQTRGASSDANQALQKAKLLAQNSDITEIDDLQVNLQQAKIAVDQGKSQRARVLTETWKEDQKLNSETVERPTTIDDHLRKYRQIILARLYLSEGRLEGALKMLNLALAEARSLDRLDLTLEIQILSAVTYHHAGNLHEARTALEIALAIGEATGLTRLFIDEGEVMANLIYDAASKKNHSEFAGRLLGLFPELSREENLLGKQAGLIKPLTNRELEVLKLISEGKSNREIALLLSISLNTVKGHSHRIFTKLNAKNRTQASAIAKTLDILN